MSLHSKIAIVIIALGLVAMVGWRILEPRLDHASQVGISDAGEKGTIQIAVDGWVGYFPFCSQEIKRRLNRMGYGLVCTDDAADYNDRFKKLKQNQYDFVVATVDSYILNGERFGFPGAIISVIDESSGGDAIIARKASGSNINEIKSLESAKIAFTPNSPSHHLLKSAASHFDVPIFKEKKNFIETQGSEDALKELQKGNADVAVLWEPEVSKALKNSDFTRILGTEVTRELIVDILIGSKRTLTDEPNKVRSLLKAYFETQKYFRNNPEELVKAISKHYNLNKKTAATVLGGVSWASLSDNAKRWYGVDTNHYSDESLITAINSASSVLIENGDFKKSPIPNEDPYILTRSTFIKELYESYGLSGGFVTSTNNSDTQRSFTDLSSAQWAQLEDVGSLKARKISFASSSSMLTLEGKLQIDEMVADLKHYPLFRVEVRGHTGLRGDKDANLALSKERAEAVLNYVNGAHSLDPNRIRAIGFGGTKPLKKKTGESSRAYNYRLPRVEIALVGEAL